jgi:hypothetical protein
MLSKELEVFVSAPFSGAILGFSTASLFTIGSLSNWSFCSILCCQSGHHWHFPSYWIMLVAEH